jgi:hypothetical protein
MKKIGILIVLLLAVASAFAFSFDVSISPSEQVIRMNETAEYQVTITHDANRAVSIEMYSLDIFWDFRTEDRLTVPRDGLTTTLKVRPLRDRNPGFYGVPLTFHAREFGVSTKETLLVGLKPTVDVLRQYVPSVRTTVNIPDQVDPRQPVPITVDLENLNKRNITHMSVHVRSNLLNKDDVVALLPNENKQLRYTLELDENTAPQDDTLRISFVTEHEERTIRFDSKPAVFSVVEYGDIDESIEITKSFLKVRKETHLTNTGNNVKTTEYKVRAGFFADMFTKTEPRVKSQDGFYVWDITLQPGETRSIIISQNYWALFIALILLGLVLLAYYLFRSPVLLMKEARSIRGMRELKVIVTVKNRSHAPIEKISLIERLPKMFEAGTEFGPGNVKPEVVAKIRSRKTNEVTGTKIQWDITSLGPREEMIVQYRIKSRLALMGTVTLQPLTAKVKTAHKQTTIKSNTATVKIGQ